MGDGTEYAHVLNEDEEHTQHVYNEIKCICVFQGKSQEIYFVVLGISLERDSQGFYLRSRALELLEQRPRSRLSNPIMATIFCGQMTALKRKFQSTNKGFVLKLFFFQNKCLRLLRRVPTKHYKINSSPTKIDKILVQITASLKSVQGYSVLAAALFCMSKSTLKFHTIFFWQTWIYTQLCYNYSYSRVFSVVLGKMT